MKRELLAKGSACAKAQGPDAACCISGTARRSSERKIVQEETGEAGG